MAIILKMPSLSPTMESGVISLWRKKEGEHIDVGEVIAEIETDKAVMDFEMADEGYVRALLAEPGQEIAVGAPIAILSESEDEDITTLLEQAKSAAAPAATPAPEAESPSAPPPSPGVAAPTAASLPVAAAAPPAPNVAGAAGMASGEAAPVPPAPPPAPAPFVPQSEAVAQVAPPTPAGHPAIPTAIPPAGQNGGRVKISPYGRKLAEQHQIDWRALVGSGPGGRIVAQDVESVIARGGALSAAGAPATPGISAIPGVSPAVGGGTPAASTAPSASTAPAAALPVQPPAPGVTHQDLPLSMMRKAIAKKMEQSKQSVPHFQATRKVRMERLMAAREALNREWTGEFRISVNDMILKACAAALRAHPAVNSQYLGDRIRRFYTVDISVAVGTDDGLITPILRNVENKGLRQISAEVRELAGRARDKKLAPEEYTGGTFTISNLGMYGITEFNGIINTPQACLLAVAGILREPVVEGDHLVIGQTMNITLSSDHRIVDGLTAAQFLDTLTRLLENPVAMLL